MSDARDRWRVWVSCRDCKEVYECTKPSWSLEPVMVDGSKHRMFVAGTTETCPACHNLKAVPG